MIDTENDSMPGYCRLKRYMGTTDLSGGSGDTWTLEPVVFSCDVLPTDTTEWASTMQGKERVVNANILTVPITIDVRSPDRIEQVSIDTAGNVLSVIATYEVVDLGDTDPYETGQELIAKQVS